MSHLWGLQPVTQWGSVRMLFIALSLLVSQANLSGQENTNPLPGSSDTTIVLGQIAVEAIKISTRLDNHFTVFGIENDSYERRPLQQRR